MVNREREKGSGGIRDRPLNLVWRNRIGDVIKRTERLDDDELEKEVKGGRM